MAAERQMIISAVPLLSLYTEVDPGDFLPALLDDSIEYIEAGDTVLWDIPGCAEAREGVVLVTMPDIEYCIVEFKFGAQRSCHIDDIQLLLKASARETKTPQKAIQSVS